MHSIAVLGGSNGGYAAAADFTARGFDVNWYLQTPEHHEPVLESGTIELRIAASYRGRRTPDTNQSVTVETVTTDVASAIAGVDIVVVPLPTTTHREVADAVVPHLEPGQQVLLTPGNCGSVVFHNMIREAAIDTKEVSVAETPTLPYVTRRSGPGEVTINLDAVRLPVGAFPGQDTDRVLETVSDLYPVASPAANALDAALLNSNPCVNATPTVLNAGAIESEETTFNIHRHGVGERMLQAILAVDAERVRIREALDFGGPHITQDEYYHPGPETGPHFYGDRSREALMEAATFSDDPPSLDHRYIHEDIRIATVLLASVGRFVDVDIEMTDAIVTIAERLMDVSYRDTGRTLNRLGLAVEDITRFHTILERGFEPE